MKKTFLYLIILSTFISSLYAVPPAENNKPCKEIGGEINSQCWYVNPNGYNRYFCMPVDENAGRYCGGAIVVGG